MYTYVLHDAKTALQGVSTIYDRNDGWSNRNRKKKQRQTGDWIKMVVAEGGTSNSTERQSHLPLNTQNHTIVRKPWRQVDKRPQLQLRCSTNIANYEQNISPHGKRQEICIEEIEFSSGS